MGGNPFDRVMAALETRNLLKGRSCKVTSAQVRARCPAHRDERASLSASLVDDRVLLNCFAGCRKEDIVGALGLRMADLFSGPPGTRTSAVRTIVATYDYMTPMGDVIAQKVRYSDKQFLWRRPAGSGAWKWGLEAGLPAHVYRRPFIENMHRLFLVEGEKSTDFLAENGVPATCPPAGASRWDRAWSVDLWEAGCRELVILPDHDRVGDDHAERAAASVSGLVSGNDAIRVKVLRLQGLQKGQDVFDWLHSGASTADLLRIAAMAPWWSADAKARDRAERRRALTRERVRNLRERRRRDLLGPAVIRTVA